MKQQETLVIMSHQDSETLVDAVLRTVKAAEKLGITVRGPWWETLGVDWVQLHLSAEGNDVGWLRLFAADLVDRSVKDGVLASVESFSEETEERKEDA